MNIASIRKCKSGNATVLLALGMPMLVGGAGLGVDLAQWYTWKRELQFAVDQAAIAGAWAKAADNNGTTYVTRAGQEYTINLHATADFDSGPTVTLENYDGGTDNSIMVAASATNTLPFSAFLTGAATTVSVSAQAIFEPGATYNPCLLALDPTASQAMNFNGGPSVTAACGIGAISTAGDAIRFVGNSGAYDLGFAITAGGVDDNHDHLDNAEVVTGARNLEDPFDDLIPPDNPTPRSLSCGAANATYTADETVTITTQYAYFTGSNPNRLTSYPNYPNPQQGSSSSTGPINLTFSSQPSYSPNTTAIYTEVSGKGNNKVWEELSTTTAKTYTNVVSNGSPSTDMQPGTYAGFSLSCDTTLAGGVYVIDGGELNVNAQYTLTGSGVMFVLKNGAGIKINGGATINLSAMTENELITAGVAADEAEKLAGMLIFEDPNSSGAAGNKINGNAGTVMNGVVYLPKSSLTLLGTAKGTSECLQIASKTLSIGGTADLTTLCPTDVVPKGAVSSVNNVVRLVA